jgi:diaminopropionate ammonia-lyase
MLHQRLPETAAETRRRSSWSSSRRGQPACYESAKARRMVTVPHGEPTVMAMLECATPSPLAWEVLRHLADGYVTLEEHEAMLTQCANFAMLVNPPLGVGNALTTNACRRRRKRRHRSGRLFQCMNDPKAREHLGLGPNPACLSSSAKAQPIPAIYDADCRPPAP